MVIRGTLTAADEATWSIDEVPVNQLRTNDSRSHIVGGAIKTGDAGGIAPTKSAKVLSFNRGDLVLDTDEALFLNTADITGAPTVNTSVNVWYET